MSDLAKNPRAWAHRGGSLESPENTDLAMKHAHDLGFGHIETDVQVSKDGVVVVQHDPTLNRCWDVDAWVKDLTWDELSKLRGPDGARMMTLEEMLLTYPETQFNIDPKHPSNVEAMLKVIRLCGAQERITCGAFDTESLRIIRNRYNQLGIRTGMSQKEAGLYFASALLGSTLTKGLKGRLRSQGIFALQVPVHWKKIEIVTDRFVRVCHDTGLQVQVWTVDEPDVMHRLLDKGVDVVMTDKPSVLKAVLTERGEWEE